VGAGCGWWSRTGNGLVGDYAPQRATYSCTRCGRGHAPLDAEGSGGSLSPGLARGVCRRGIDESFADATDLLTETLGV